MTERELQDAITHLAQLRGWLVYHPYDSRKSEPGFPDLTMVRDGRLVFAELKSAKGKVSPAQRVWLQRLEATSAEVHVWYPHDWPAAVVGVLS